MRSTGVVRQLDELGRLVLPSELRHARRWEKGDAFEVLVQGDLIILRKCELTCVFCGGTHELVEFTGKRVCGNCRSTLASADVTAAVGDSHVDLPAV